MQAASETGWVMRSPGARVRECPADGRASHVFRALFDAHAPDLRRYARRIVGSPDAAEDVVQDVFLRLWLAWDRIEIGDATRSYLYISTRARALNSVRRAQRESARRQRAADEASASLSSPDGEPDDARPPDVALLMDAVERVLAAMPPRQRAVLALRFRSARSNTDIARELGISPRTVDAHLARGMKAFRRWLPGLLAGDVGVMDEEGEWPGDAIVTHG